MNGAASELKIEGLVKHAGGVAILNNVNFSVKRGEIVALVGQSGCGKTTFLRCVSGLHGHDGGTISMDGNTMESFGLPRWRTRVLYSAQDRHTAGFEETPYQLAQAISRFAAVRSMMLPDAALEIARRFRIPPEKFRSKWKQLSGGEQARCHLAIVIAQNPAYMLLDEPTASLDRHTTQLVEEEIRRTKAGVIWVTHSPEQAQRFNRIVDFNKK